MRIAILLMLAISLQACTTYTIVSAVTFIATDKALPDHVSSTLVPNADCNAVHVVTKGQYYCEVRDIAVTYNRQFP